ncbi:cytochrome P450 [Aspergillus vadensis CBS 113365]|uniref:Cytochrome P450 n=1 Tax=Aspergillus vadensis (strain CBS 113365 / IMI 142717 / IBT 24658) TaxID=1448311 RepID=A0A319AZW6_ASPVC|nr:cytochrome P450 [Aspergillus vadensis CBS 113365]PYH65867.1 cytochrome P450 [Aspergillus vadensis CBS 113365]
MSNYTEIIPPAYFLPGVCLTVASLLLLSLVQNAIHNLPYYRIPADYTIFQTIFPHGPMLILHPKYINKVRRHPSLNLEKAVKKVVYPSLPVRDYPGFETFRGTENHHILLDIINQKITQNLTLTLEEHFSQPTVSYIIARLSTLVFLGKEPPILQPVIHWFLAPARKLRQRVQVAQQIIQQEIERRQEKPKARKPDTLDWLHKITAGRSLDVTTAQIGLTLVTIHTISNLFTNVIYNLAANPEYIPFLHEKIQSVLEADGTFHKTSLTKLKLLDSVEITLSDRIIIPKNTSLVVSVHTMQNESIYPNPHTYDRYRFYQKQQEPGQGNKHQLVMTSAEHYNFRHGIHACPGQFFAANEIKILLAYIIMKYNLRFPDGQSRPANWEIGQDLICDQTAQVLFRAR